MCWNQPLVRRQKGHLLGKGFFSIGAGGLFHAWAGFSNGHLGFADTKSNSGISYFLLQPIHQLSLQNRPPGSFFPQRFLFNPVQALACVAPCLPRCLPLPAPASRCGATSPFRAFGFRFGPYPSPTILQAPVSRLCLWNTKRFTDSLLMFERQCPAQSICSRNIC